MREGIWDQSGTRPRILWSGAVLVAIGVILVLSVAEWFATFDACLADPMCNAPVSVATLEGFLALMGTGVGITVGGATIAALGLRFGLIGPTNIRTPYS